MDINHILIHFVLIIKYAFGTIDLFAITDSNASCHTQLNLEFDKTYTSGRVVNFPQSRAVREMTCGKFSRGKSDAGNAGNFEAEKL